MPVPLSGNANPKGKPRRRTLAEQIVEQVCRTKRRPSTKWTQLMDDFIHGQ